jgi:hypothetical protein
MHGVETSGNTTGFEQVLPVCAFEALIVKTIASSRQIFA